MNSATKWSLGILGVLTLIAAVWAVLFDTVTAGGHW